jgi:GTP-binding protein
MRHVQSVRFIGSFPQAPPESELPEIAFVGRSNVGKSSAINVLLNRKKAARVSQRPGRTQSINIFDLDGELRFVDLPGYGYAKVPEHVRKAWGRMMRGYLFNRPTLKLVIVLVDGRHEAQPLDLQMFASLREAGVPFQAVATKVDHIKKSKKKVTLSRLKVGLGIPDLAHFSSVTREGLDALWDHIEHGCGLKRG